MIELKFFAGDTTISKNFKFMEIPRQLKNVEPLEIETMKW